MEELQAGNRKSGKLHIPGRAVGLWERYTGGSKMAAAGCVILFVWMILAITVPLFWPWSYSEQNAQIQTRRSQRFTGSERTGSGGICSPAYGTAPGSAW